MNGQYRTRANAEDRADPPGIGRALVVVVLMIVVTAIVCAVIYGVMVAIRPIDARQHKQAYGIELPPSAAGSAAQATHAWRRCSRDLRSSSSSAVLASSSV